MQICLYTVICIYCLLMSELHMCAWYLGRSQEGVRSAGTGMTDGCEPPDRCWELNLGPQEQ